MNKSITNFHWILNSMEISFVGWAPGPCFNIKKVSLGIGNSIIKVWRSWDRLICTMGIPLLVRWHLYIETAPWSLWELQSLGKSYRVAVQLGFYWHFISFLWIHMACILMFNFFSKNLPNFQHVVNISVDNDPGTPKTRSSSTWQWRSWTWHSRVWRYTDYFLWWSSCEILPFLTFTTISLLQYFLRNMQTPCICGIFL